MARDTLTTNGLPRGSGRIWRGAIAAAVACCTGTAFASPAAAAAPHLSAKAGDVERTETHDDAPFRLPRSKVSSGGGASAEAFALLTLAVAAALSRSRNAHAKPCTIPRELKS